VEHLVRQYLMEFVTPQHDSQLIFFDLSSQYVKTKKISSFKASLEENNLLLMKIQDGYFTFPSISIIQLLKSVMITPASNSAPYIIGSASFRGEILPVIDLEDFFYKSENKKGDYKLSSDYSYIAAENNGNKIIFRVERVIGNIRSPDVSTITKFSNIHSSIEQTYFDTGFIREGKIIIQLNQESILNKIREELNEYQRTFMLENEILLSPIALPDELDAININLQDKLTSISPTYSSILSHKRELKAIKSAKKTGTLISCGKLELIIPNDRIIEIYSISSLTQIPNTPSAIIGAINFRGEVISVLDLKKILGISKSEITTTLQTNDKILIFKTNEQIFALHVGEIKSITDFNEKIIHPISLLENSETDGYYFRGAIINNTGNIVLILDIEYLFHSSLKEKYLERNIDQLILFDEPKVKESLKSQIIDRDGLMFVSNGYNYFIPSNNVVWKSNYNFNR
ncbi:MAG: chemotaxis protein CheW, partial [Candidatus Hodarchaeales archaeon]